MLGMAYDLSDEPDSTIAIYERYLETPWFARIETDMLVLADIYERLGQIYAARGDAESATGERSTLSHQIARRQLLLLARLRPHRYHPYRYPNPA